MLHKKINKTEFFDLSYSEDWAFRDYTEEEHLKLDRYLCLAGIRHGHKVLEPGCGTGRLTLKLADRVGPEGQVVSADISRKMIKVCKKRTQYLPNVRILERPVEKIDYPLHYFDIIFCLCVFPHFDDKPEILQFFEKLLQKKGRLVIAHLEGSLRLNKMHMKKGGAVMKDRIPPFSEMVRMVEEAGFQMEMFQDRDDGYYFLAGLRDDPKQP
jgi:demethylmenaquinone methyltransferase/2-methoxy-6-polyprenyl-1,4-benzoquinol methylase